MNHVTVAKDPIFNVFHNIDIKSGAKPQTNVYINALLVELDQQNVTTTY